MPMVEGELTDLDEGTVLISTAGGRRRRWPSATPSRSASPTGRSGLEVAGIYKTDNTGAVLPFTPTLSTLADAGFQVADNYLLDPDRRRTPTSPALPGAIEAQTAELPTVTVKDQAGFADEQRRRSTRCCC